MGLFKLIILVVFLFIAYQLGKVVLRRIQLHKNSSRTQSKPIANIVKCVVCGTHVPVKEASLNQRGDYQCRDHFNSA